MEKNYVQSLLLNNSDVIIYKCPVTIKQVLFRIYIFFYFFYCLKLN